MNLALVTYNDNGLYHIENQKNEDDLLLAYLRTKGLVVEKVIWDNPEVNWKQFDYVILKSPWDYFNKVTQFYNWLRYLETINVTLVNPIETVRWNSDKHYLADIELAGLPVVASTFLEQHETADLHTLLRQSPSAALIVKPVISGGSKNTFKVNTENVAEINISLNKLLEKESFIVQNYLPEIVAKGEWSFVFFGGKYSHSLIKKAKKGDFRVQHSFGGTIHVQEPSTSLIHNAQHYVDQFARSCLYARVDGVMLNETFHLMELELIEPYLFLETEEESLEAYYQALIRLIEK